MMQIKDPSEMIMAIIYVKDFDICIDSLHDFKKHLKAILQPQFYPQIKLIVGNIKNQFIGTIKNGSIKLIEIFFAGIETSLLRKLFT